MGFLSRGIQNTLLFLIAVSLGQLIFHFTGSPVYMVPTDRVAIYSLAIFFISGVSEDEH